jgi:hypothetical protein
LLKRSVVISRLGYETLRRPSHRGRPTVHRSAPFHHFRALQGNLKAPRNFDEGKILI